MSSAEEEAKGFPWSSGAPGVLGASQASRETSLVWSVQPPSSSGVPTPPAPAPHPMSVSPWMAGSEEVWRQDLSFMENGFILLPPRGHYISSATGSAGTLRTGQIKRMW